MLKKYLDCVKKTDKLPKDNIEPVIFGLLGEVGELLTIRKKEIREEKYKQEGYIEELGDIFWYLSCLSIRSNLNLEKIFRKNNNFKNKQNIGNPFCSLVVVTGIFFSKKEKINEELIQNFLIVFFEIIRQLEINFKKEILKTNSEKVQSRFLKNEPPPKFDENFPEYEKIPEKFKIEFLEKEDRKVILRWNKVLIGDPLSDNNHDNDGYRYHDIFHLSYAAILHWSPIFRSLIKHKRKSNPKIDDEEDGGRAKVIEEGISILIFNFAKKNNFFEGVNELPFNLLKNIQQMIKGLEVEKCPLSLWEEAILKGYKVFRKMKKNGNGIVICNKKNRTISYEKI